MSDKDRETANVGAGLWKGTGMWAWLLHRVSGLILVFYLFAHIGVISQGAVQGPEAFSELMERLENPLFVILDLALIGAVLYHGMNGIRVLLFDVGVGIRRYKSLYAVAMVAGAVCLAAFAYVSFAFIF